MKFNCWCGGIEVSHHTFSRKCKILLFARILTSFELHPTCAADSLTSPFLWHMKASICVQSSIRQLWNCGKTDSVRFCKTSNRTNVMLLAVHTQMCTQGLSTVDVCYTNTHRPLQCTRHSWYPKWAGPVVMEPSKWRWWVLRPSSWKRWGLCQHQPDRSTHLKSCHLMSSNTHKHFQFQAFFKFDSNSESIDLEIILIKNKAVGCKSRYFSTNCMALL